MRWRAVWAAATITLSAVFATSVGIASEQLQPQHVGWYFNAGRNDESFSGVLIVNTAENVKLCRIVKVVRTEAKFISGNNSNMWRKRMGTL